MKIDVTSPTPVKRTLAIEVEPDEMQRETQEVLRGYARKARIPGFRPGKAPLDVVRTRFGKEIEEDVRERVIARCFREAAEDKGLRPLGDPIVDGVNQDEGQPLRFSVSFEILPEIEVKNYREVEVRRPPVALMDTEVDEALEELRQSKATLVTEEGRGAVTGDVLVCDLEGQPERGERFSRERVLIEVGATHNPPAFNEKLEGVEAGTELEFPVDYPKEYENEALAGQTVRYTVKVHEVKVRTVPELDDEFAKDLGEFDDLAALRVRVREDLEQRKRHEADRQVRESVLDKVLLENPVVLPDVLVDEEIRHRLEELVRRMVMQGIDPEKVELDWKQLRDQQEQPARKAVHARLILDAVARAESIAVDDGEVDERLRRDAAAMGEKVEALRKHIQKRGGVEAFKNQLVREKSLDLLTSIANIQNEE